MLSEGFATCSDYECTCTFNCSLFSSLAYQAFAPLTVAETDAHYLLYANTVLYILEKPKPAPQPASTTPPENATKPATTGTTPPGNTAAQPSAEQPGVPQPLNATEAQPPPSAPASLNATRQASAALNASAAPSQGLSRVEHPPEQAGAEPVPAWLPAAAAAVAVLVIYLLYRRRHL